MKNKNTHRLEKDKFYWFRHYPSGGKWFRGKVTRFTSDGFPWVDSKDHSGICNNDYEIMHCSSEKELEEKAKDFLINKGYNGFANETNIPKMMAKFYNEISPEFEQEIINRP